MKPASKLPIRNRPAGFLICTRQAGEAGIEVRVAEERVWLTQKLMTALFEVNVPPSTNVWRIFLQQGEIALAATIRNFRTVQPKFAIRI